MTILVSPFVLFCLFLIGVKYYLKQTLNLSFFSWGLLHDLLVISIIYSFLWSINIPWLVEGVTILFMGFFGLIVVVDSVYYRYFDTLTSKTNLQGLDFFQKSDSSLGKEYDIKIPWHGYFAFLITILFIVAVMTIQTRMTFDFRLVLSVILLVELLFLLSLARPKSSATLKYYLSNKYLFLAMPNRLEFCKRYGYLFYHSIDLIRPKPWLNKHKFKQDIDTFFDAVPKKEPNAMSGFLNKSNVILITAESFDTRLIDPILTPTLYDFTKKGVTFENYYVPVFQQGATSNSEFMAMSGLYALNSNAYGNNVFHAFQDNVFPYALPNQLKNIGYQTYYFHSGHEWFYQRSKVMPKFGFDIVKFQEDLQAIGYKDFNEQYDSKMITFFDAYVDLKRPFYVQLLTYSMHGAYNQEAYTHHDERVSQVYAHGISLEARVYLQKLVEFDKLLENIVNRLKKANVFNQTLIAITADHYPYMLSNKDLRSLLKVDLNHEALHKQTLILHHTAFKGLTSKTIASSIDIAPTILNLVYPKGVFSYFLGEDLFDRKNDTILLHDLSITNGVDRVALHHYNRINGDYNFKTKLESFITKYEISHKLLNIDYFKSLENKK